MQEDRLLHSSIPSAEGRELNSDCPDKTRISKQIVRYIFWMVCSSTAIYTTKLLMTSYGYHYPLTISCRSFASMLLAYAILPKSIDPNTKPVTLTHRLFTQCHTFREGKCWMAMLPAALFAATSIPSLFEGILHLPSLHAVTMLFPMVYATESFGLFAYSSKTSSRRSISSGILVVTAASASILYTEYRLMVPGILWTLVGILLLGASRAYLRILLESEANGLANKLQQDRWDAFVTMSLIFGTLLSLGLACIFERSGPVRKYSRHFVSLSGLNFFSIAGTAYTGGFPMVFWSQETFNHITKHSSFHFTFSELAVSTGSCVITVLLTILYSTPVSISPLQVTAFVIAICSLFRWFHSSSENLMPWSRRSKSDGGSACCLYGVVHNIPSGAGLVVVLMITVSSSFIFLYQRSISGSTTGFPARLDWKYNTSNPFDIVISHYDEDSDFLATTIASIKSTTYLSTMIPRVVLYTKSKSIDLDLLKNTTGADIVRKLENRGREGGTYLHHITAEWDNLAQQTMFIQAHVHNSREITGRINDFLAPETGMLSLGFSGITCSCQECDDQWGWQDQWSMVPSLHKKIYSSACDATTRILLSYKGQFVVSARRIKGIKKEIYSELLEAITSTSGWSHDSKFIGKFEDGVDNPYFGFTLERVWSLLFQCGTNGRIAARCPSLLSGQSMFRDKEDCQCLDYK